MLSRKQLAKNEQERRRLALQRQQEEAQKQQQKKRGKEPPLTEQQPQEEPSAEQQQQPPPPAPAEQQSSGKQQQQQQQRKRGREPPITEQQPQEEPPAEQQQQQPRPAERQPSGEQQHQQPQQKFNSAGRPIFVPKFAPLRTVAPPPPPRPVTFAFNAGPKPSTLPTTLFGISSSSSNSSGNGSGSGGGLFRSSAAPATNPEADQNRSPFLTTHVDPLIKITTDAIMEEPKLKIASLEADLVEQKKQTDEANKRADGERDKAVILEKKIDDLDSSNNAYYEQNGELQAHVDRVEAEAKKLRDELTKTKNEHDNTNSLMEKLQKELEEEKAKELLPNNAAQIKKNEDTIASLKRDLATSQQQALQIQTELGRSERQRHEAGKLSIVLEHTLKEREDETARIMNEVGTLEVERNQLLDMYDVLKEFFEIDNDLSPEALRDVLSEWQEEHHAPPSSLRPPKARSTSLADELGDDNDSFDDEDEEEEDYGQDEGGLDEAGEEFGEGISEDISDEIGEDLSEDVGEDVSDHGLGLVLDHLRAHASEFPDEAHDDEIHAPESEAALPIADTSAQISDEPTEQEFSDDDPPADPETTEDSQPKAVEPTPTEPKPAEAEEQQREVEHDGHEQEGHEGSPPHQARPQDHVDNESGPVREQHSGDQSQQVPQNLPLQTVFQDGPKVEEAKSNTTRPEPSSIREALTPSVPTFWSVAALVIVVLMLLFSTMNERRTWLGANESTREYLVSLRDQGVWMWPMNSQKFMQYCFNLEQYMGFSRGLMG